MDTRDADLELTQGEEPSSATVMLSFPLSRNECHRLETLAAKRGETIDRLLRGLVRDYLALETGGEPSLATVLGRLRDRAELLRSHGIRSLAVFGSIARGEAKPGSDVDLLADIEPTASLSLVRLASLRAELSDLLGAPADLVERQALRPAVRAAAERDAISVW